MPATGPSRIVLATVLAAVLSLVVVPAVAGAASASTTPLGSGDATVRVVARTDAGALAAVTRAAEAAGATRIGRVPQLRSVTFSVPSSGAAALRARLAARADVTSVGVAHRRWFSAAPNDPRFAEEQPYLDATGISAAWDRGAVGSPDVRIAIVDSGVDVRHPDLAGKVVGTYNAVTGSTDVHDVVGHGTGTASVAAAATDNAVGIAGAGRNSSLLAVKVADVTGRIFTDNLARGIVWAVDHGADVVNLSLGGPTSDRLEKAAVSYAQAHGALVVAAAGNEGTAAKQYPGALPGVLAVGATSANGSSRAPFSSYGGWVDLAAPGRSVVVAVPGGGFETADGTSYSAPLVSGAAALLAGYRPGRSADELAQALVGGTDATRYGFAHGLVHVDRSLDLLPPASVPTLTLPASGTAVAGVVTVSAASAAPRVRLTFADLASTVTTSGGVASATFESYGLSGDQRVTATDCSAVDQCNASPAVVGVVVGNGTPTLTSPAPAQDVRADSLTVAAMAPGGAVRLYVDGTPGVIDRSAPFAADLPTESLADGTHAVRAAICRSDGSVCDQAHPAEVAVQVNRLHPGISKVSPARISPNGDGRRDRTTVTYRLDRAQATRLQVRDAGGQVVYTRGLGNRPAGTSSAGWDGRRSGGGVLPNGSYTVQVATSDGTLQGLVSTEVAVDRSRPAVHGLGTSAKRVLPVRDRYLDTVQVSAGVGESLRSLDLQVTTRSGSVVRTVHAGSSRSAGTRSVTWDGRLAGGRLAPGTYRLRLVAEDLAGNRTTSAARTVTVSGQRLVKRSGHLTVTARSSLTETYEDACSEVFRRTSGPHRGWVSYASSSTCTSGDAFAAADHQVRLPAAVRYGTVQVSAFGGRSDKRFRDSAKVVYYDSLQNLSKHSFRLAPPVATYTGPRVAAEPLLIRSRALRWMTIATGVSWYDVASYRVDYTLFVLR